VTLSPPGWYPDPAPPAPGNPPLLRFWDGQQWSWQVAAAPLGVAYAGQRADQPTTPDGVPLAGWWARVAAYVIDGLIVGTAGSVATIPMQIGMQRDIQELLQSEPTPREFFAAYLDIFLPLLTWSTLIGFVVWAGYNALMLRFKGATVGKLVLGLAVRLRERPGQLPWSAIAARIMVQQGVSLTVFVPLLYLALSWFPLLDNLWASWDGKRQALHDKAARTNVVRTR
jgi:uncharacterized RDD family membrane protein YckC